MLGKHVYIQKPLTQTVGEARELLRLARLNGVCSQMGNQGHAGEGIRLVREWFQAGLLGEVREAQIWTNRPVWPQGMQAWPKADTPPAGFDQNLFLGRAPDRPYSSEIHPFKWRGIIDYGCGALGDMACHIMDAAYWNLELAQASSVTVELKKIEQKSAVAFPKSAVVEFNFPARGKLPPVKLTWYEGGDKPETPAGLKQDNRQLAKGGQLIIGSKGTVYDGNDYCNSPRFIPEAKHKELVEGGKMPPKTVPRVPENNPHKEWVAAIRKNDPSQAGSNFEYSVPFTEAVCLGTMAILAGGKFTFDPVKMTTDREDVNKLLYPTYRRGWEIDAMGA
jgi:predicted dehydrogenase